MLTGKEFVNGSHIIHIHDEIYASDKLIRETPYQLWNLGFVHDFHATTADLEIIALQDKKAAKINPDMLIAVVCNQDLIFGLARMWQAFIDEESFQSMVCRKIEDAEKWIKNNITIKHTLSQEQNNRKSEQCYRINPLKTVFSPGC